MHHTRTTSLGKLTFSSSSKLQRLLHDQRPESTPSAHPSQSPKEAEEPSSNQDSSIFDEKALLGSIIRPLFDDAPPQQLHQIIATINYSALYRAHAHQDTTQNEEEEHLRVQAIFNCKVEPNLPWKCDTSNQQEAAQNAQQVQLNPEKEEDSTRQSSDSPRDQFADNEAYLYYQSMNLYRQLHRKRRSLPSAPSFAIDPSSIEQDGRTTLMIRHIPNKYTEQMLFHEISRKFKNRVNFLYLPMDPFNDCNMGYAFVNFTHTAFVRPFVEEFNGRRWSRFNSGKICELAYARIQGANSLASHVEKTANNARCRGRTEAQKSRPTNHHSNLQA